MKSVAVILVATVAIAWSAAARAQSQSSESRNRLPGEVEFPIRVSPFHTAAPAQSPAQIHYTYATPNWLIYSGWYAPMYGSYYGPCCGYYTAPFYVAPRPAPFFGGYYRY
jgi:hypothetical protein